MVIVKTSSYYFVITKTVIICLHLLLNAVAFVIMDAEATSETRVVTKAAKLLIKIVIHANEYFIIKGN